jgi:hypothetical protein
MNLQVEAMFSREEAVVPDCRSDVQEDASGSYFLNHAQKYLFFLRFVEVDLDVPGSLTGNELVFVHLYAIVKGVNSSLWVGSLRKKRDHSRFFSLASLSGGVHPNIMW